MAAKQPPPSGDGLTRIRQKALRQIDDIERVTIIGTSQQSEVVGRTSYDESAPRFKVIRYEIEKDQELIISGSESLIPLQLSLIDAIDSVLKLRLDWTVNQFWEWAKEFENGFLDRAGGKDEFTNWKTKSTPWGNSKENRPRIMELKPREDTDYTGPLTNKKKPSLIKVVQFWPNRKDSEFCIFSGQYRDIATQIMIYWNQKVGDGSKGKIKSDIYPLLKGRPLIKLHFYSNEKDKGVAQAEIGLRIMDKIDNPKPSDDLQKISEADLKQYANRIVANFAKPKPYVWQKGKDCVSYRSRSQGLEGYYFCRNLADGVQLIQRLLAITGQFPIPTKIIYSKNSASAAAYPEEPRTISVLGQTVKEPKLRPLVDVKFVSAEIYLASLPKPIRLVDHNGKILV
jgi:hypothetical protein